MLPGARRPRRTGAASRTTRLPRWWALIPPRQRGRGDGGIVGGGMGTPSFCQQKQRPAGKVRRDHVHRGMSPGVLAVCFLRVRCGGGV